MASKLWATLNVFHYNSHYEIKVYHNTTKVKRTRPTGNRLEFKRLRVFDPLIETWDLEGITDLINEYETEMAKIDRLQA